MSSRARFPWKSKSFVVIYTGITFSQCFQPDLFGRHDPCEARLAPAKAAVAMGQIRISEERRALSDKDWIEEGFRQLEAVGLEGLSPRALAESAGVSTSALHRLFADKSKPLSALAAAGFGDFAAILERSREGESRPPL